MPNALSLIGGDHYADRNQSWEPDFRKPAAAVLDRIERDLGTTELPIVSLPYRDLVMQANSAT